MARPKKYPDELVERGVRLALESGRPIAHVAADLGMHPETLRKKVRQAQADSGARPDLPTKMLWKKDQGLFTAIHQFRHRDGFLYGFLGHIEGESEKSAVSPRLPLAPPENVSTPPV